MRYFTKILGVGAVLLVAAAGAGWAQQDIEQDNVYWLPYSASDYSYNADLMYKVIFWVTTGMFVLVEGLLLGFCIVYRRRPGHRPMYTHGNVKAEVTWTVVPGLMLLGLALWQIPHWNHIKKPDWKTIEQNPNTVVVDVFGEQFKWNFRYKGSKEKVKDAEYDLTNLSQLHVPLGSTVMLNLRSKDVIHSVYIPHMRVKQDTTPGLRQRIWFKPTRFKMIKLLAEDANGVKTPTKPRMVKENYNENASFQEQPFEWCSDPKDFEPNGKYFGKRVAVPTGTGYWQTDGLYRPINPAGKVRTLYKGEVKDGGNWSECDYAVGWFEMACAELCGEGHYTMRAFLWVEPPAAYKFWFEDETVNASEPAPIWKLWKD